jgi:hypothetical protein
VVFPQEVSIKVCLASIFIFILTKYVRYLIAMVMYARHGHVQLLKFFQVVVMDGSSNSGNYDF